MDDDWVQVLWYDVALEKMDLLKAKTTIGGVAYAVYPNIWGWQVGSGMLLFCW